MRLFYVLLFAFSITSFCYAKPIKLGKIEVFELQNGVGAFSIDERVQAIEARLKSTAKDRTTVMRS